mmetsp:Transcript_67298/g.217254  ORF Transcript_67298/g.217254 Transcript_67298/m.217254 type:complete len:255 (+) Transcript_67298:1148-1912(+)
MGHQHARLHLLWRRVDPITPSNHRPPHEDEDKDDKATTHKDWQSERLPWMFWALKCSSDEDCIPSLQSCQHGDSKHVILEPRVEFLAHGVLVVPAAKILFHLLGEVLPAKAEGPPAPCPPRRGVVAAGDEDPPHDLLKVPLRVLLLGLQRVLPEGLHALSRVQLAACAAHGGQVQRVPHSRGGLQKAHGEAAPAALAACPSAPRRELCELHLLSQGRLACPRRTASRLRRLKLPADPRGLATGERHEVLRERLP